MIQLNLLLETFIQLKDEPYAELCKAENGDLFYRSPSKVILVPPIFGRKNSNKIKLGFITNSIILKNIDTLTKVSSIDFNHIICWLFCENKKTLIIDMFDNWDGKSLGTINIILSSYTNRYYYKFYRWWLRFKKKLKHKILLEE